MGFSSLLRMGLSVMFPPKEVVTNTARPKVKMKRDNFILNSWLFVLAL